MLDFHITPFLPEILSHESSVTLVRFVLAAQEARVIQLRWLQLGLDLPITDQRVEALLVCRPIDALFPVGTQDFLGWNKQRLSFIICVADFA